MIRRLRVMFVCILMTVVTGMLTLMLVLQYRTSAANLRTASITAMESAAMNPAVSTRPGSVQTSAAQPCFTLALSFTGDLLASGGGYYDLSDMELLWKIYRAAQDSEQDVGELEDYSLRFLRVQAPVGELFVFTDISAELQSLRSQRQTSVFIGVTCWAAFLVLSLLLSRWIVRPVEKAWREQRQFVADASHELKTPLTVIMTNAELLQERDLSEDDRDRFTKSILTMSRQMRGLVESLLELARADAGLSAAESERVDFSRTVSDAVLPFEPLYFEQGRTLESGIQPDIFVNGSAGRLRQVAEILLDNGVKYSTPGGTVRLTLERQGRSALLRVSSPGETLSPQQCKDIFQRFYRADKARSMNRSYGLGLAIAQRIVTDSHGRIWAESAGGINTFFVALPLA